MEKSLKNNAWCMWWMGDQEFNNLIFLKDKLDTKLKMSWMHANDWG